MISITRRLPKKLITLVAEENVCFFVSPVIMKTYIIRSPFVFHSQKDKYVLDNRRLIRILIFTSLLRPRKGNLIKY